MSRTFNLSTKTLGILIMIGLFLISAITWLAFNKPLAASPHLGQVSTHYPMGIGLQQIADNSGRASPSLNAEHSDYDHHCIIALDRTAPRSLSMYGSSSLIAPNCSVRSRSSSRMGVSLDDVEQLQAAVVKNGDTVNPFAWMELPASKQCDHQNLTLKAGIHHLKPGIYCGGIVSLSAEQIVLAPGTYTIKNGPLAIGGRASFIGEGVSLIFEGPDAVFSFGVATKLALKAPTAGPLAGFIFFENPNAPINREFVVRSHDAEMLEGVIYLPRGKFIVDSYGRVGQSSLWSAVIANKVEIINGAHLQINSNHAGSDVPLPRDLKFPQELAATSIN